MYNGNNNHPNLTVVESNNYTYVSTGTPDKVFPNKVGDVQALEIPIGSAPRRPARERKELQKKSFFRQR
jgi:hypothetical protein